MNYPDLSEDILELFVEARSLRRLRPGTIGRLVGRGHWNVMRHQFWYQQHKTEVHERDSERRAKRWELTPHREVICESCGTVNQVPDGRRYPVGGWCCEAMCGAAARSKRKWKGIEPGERKCARCGGEIPSEKQRSAIYCSQLCQMAEVNRRYRARAKERKAAA